jgi:hypothetical protein
MSLTKRQPAFDELMEEARRHDDTSHERYLEELYLNERKEAEPKDVHDKVGTKEDVFGMLGRIFNPKQH